MNRDELIEKMASQLSRIESSDSWQDYVDRAEAALQAIEDNGMVVMPRTASDEMIAVFEEAAAKACYADNENSHPRGQIKAGWASIVQSYINKDKG